jgi:cytochrome c-type biogenesis protein CcsB
MLKKINHALFSLPLMATLFILIIISIAAATFIENDFGTIASKAIFYNALWFETIIALLFINLIGNIFLRRLYRKEKFTVFLFHLAFAIIILGASITRFWGEEGNIHIRENQQSNLVLSSDTYLTINAKSTNDSVFLSEPVFISPLTARSYRKVLHIENKKIILNSTKYIRNAAQTLVPEKDGQELIEIITIQNQRRQNLFIESGSSKKIKNYRISYNDTSQHADMNIFNRNGQLYFRSVLEITATNKFTMEDSILVKNQVHRLNIKTLYSIEETLFVLNSYQKSGKIIVASAENNDNNLGDAIFIKLSTPDESKEITVWGSSNALGKKTYLNFEGIEFTFQYGSKIIRLPFMLKLLDFRLERYPGSNSPSSFESDVLLVDKEKNIEETRNIYMNNVLKHRGYRFYQSSYDTDEQGTVLSVNNDLTGTFVTYAGYFLLTIGMFLSLFNKNSRFQKLRKTSTAFLIVLLLAIPAISKANDENWKTKLDENTIPEQYAKQFGNILIQDNKGRIKPINTLSSEILRKVSRKENIYGLTPDQVFLGMVSNPEIWQNIPIIKISHDSIKSIIGIQSKHASFHAIMTSSPGHRYALSSHVEEAYRKKPAYRSKFDNEIIRVDERVTICYLAFKNSLLKIFPVPGDTNYTWKSPNENLSDFNTDDSLFVRNILPMYYLIINKAIEQNEWSEFEIYTKHLINFQKTYGKEIIPAEKKLYLEIKYNKLNIFDRLSRYYGSLGFIFLLIFIVLILRNKGFPGVLKKINFVIFLFLFLAQAIGLVIRWYISGHAPWSNGYEALIYISWGTVLAGIIFSVKSPVTLPITALLTFVILHVAHLSWMDPEITNLVPVLKSIWLVIHVALITLSYSFLALAALMALLNLILMLFYTKSNKKYIHSNILNFSAILEMTLIIGLYMLTVGTFLGGVWANESWGRYWGWDPKESWALITIIVYAFIAHMRMIPGLRGVYALNLSSLFGFFSVIMTYFGVNYYLAGLHSYAKGDPLPVPKSFIYTIIVLGIISITAYINHKRFYKRGTHH